MDRAEKLYHGREEEMLRVRVESRLLADAVSAREFELIQASCSKEEIDHSKPINLNCYCDSYRKIQGIKKNVFNSQSKYSKVLNGAFMKIKIFITSTEVLSLSLSLCNFHTNESYRHQASVACMR